MHKVQLLFLILLQQNILVNKGEKPQTRHDLGSDLEPEHY